MDENTDLEKSSEEYHLGCSFIALGEYKVALKYFRNALKIRGEAWPDINRNMAWCYYRIAEYEGYQDHYEKAYDLFEKAENYYIEAQLGFGDLEERAQKPELKSKIRQRIDDCEERRSGLAALREFLKRREKFQQRRANTSKSSPENASSEKASPDDDEEDDDYYANHVDEV